MVIRVANRQRSIPLRIQTYRALAQRLLLKLNQPEAELSLSFIGDAGIRSLNRTYRDMDQSTDVLAFPLAHTRKLKTGLSHPPPPILGDVVISVPTARRQARSQRHTTRREITALMVHGILHLLGHDHERSREARRMRHKEKTLLRYLLG